MLNNGNIIDNCNMTKYSPDKKPQSEPSGVKISELQLYTVKDSIKKNLFVQNEKQSKRPLLINIIAKLKKIQNKKYPIPHQKSKEELRSSVLDSVSIENFKNQKYHPKRKLCELSKFEDPNNTPIDKMIPSNAENYLERQKNIKNSNPILWLIKNKHRLDNEKRKLNINSPNSNTNNNNNTNIPNSLPKISIINDPAITQSNNKIKRDSSSETFGHLIHWKKGERIHTGQNAFIFKAFNVSCGNIFIVKEYYEDKISQLKYQNEVKYLKNLHNTHIVTFLGAELFKNKKYIYLDYVSGGNIRSFISKFGCLKEKVIKKFIKHILFALEYIHIQGFIHGNIKMSSVLVDCDGTIKLCDFSCASIDSLAFQNNVIEDNSDIKELGKVICEIIGDPNQRKISPLLLDFIEYFSNKELSVNFWDLKTHAFIK